MFLLFFEYTRVVAASVLLMESVRGQRVCALRLSVRTSDFHSGKRGSIPLGRTTKIVRY